MSYTFLTYLHLHLLQVILVCRSALGLYSVKKLNITLAYDIAMRVSKVFYFILNKLKVTKLVTEYTI